MHLTVSGTECLQGELYFIPFSPEQIIRRCYTMTADDVQCVEMPTSSISVSLILMYSWTNFLLDHLAGGSHKAAIQWGCKSIGGSRCSKSWQILSLLYTSICMCTLYSEMKLLFSCSMWYKEAWWHQQLLPLPQLTTTAIDYGVCVWFWFHLGKFWVCL